MSESAELIGCVPNISQGRNPQCIERIRTVLEDSAVRLLHVDSNIDANRTVVSFVGTLDEVSDAVRVLFEVCAQEIDLRSHTGAHPYIGAVDVCPFIPLTAAVPIATMHRRIATLAEEISTRYALPIFLYEYSASQNGNRSLSKIRKGGIAGLAQRLAAAECKPDFGPAALHPRLGASVLGHRDLLIAYNVNLRGASAKQAKRIALAVRGSSAWIRAIAWEMPAYGCYQISMNLLRFWEFGLYDAFEACMREAAKHDVVVDGSELIGLVPQQALMEVSDHLGQHSCLEAAISYLGLSSVRTFQAEQQVLEHSLNCEPFRFPVHEAAHTSER